MINNIKRIVIASMLISFVLLNMMCSKKEQLLDNKSGNEILKRKTNGATYSCGSSFSGNFYGSGYYAYSAITIDLSANPTGTIVQVKCDQVEVPNRFSIYEGSNLLVSTGWIGVADYPGPWGNSISIPATSVLSFIKGASNSYSLIIETAPQGLTDTWNVSISCASGSPTPEPGCACETYISDSRTGTGYYTYPNKLLDLSCAPYGGKYGLAIQLHCDPVDVPNRFSVYNADGQFVATSGWIGTADYSGPWGASLNSPSAQDISFTRDGTSSFYYLKVETSTLSNAEDAWNVSIICPSGPGQQL